MKRKNSYNSILGLVFLIFLATIIFFNNAIGDKVFSQSENRRLEQRPKLYLSQLKDGRFTSSYEKYLTDQFPFRDFWIGVKSQTERLLGKKENNGVYLGKDGYLLEKYQVASRELMEKNIGEINKFVEKMGEANIYLMLVPSGGEILKEKLPAYAPMDRQIGPLDFTRESISKNICYVDVYQGFMAEKDKYIYYKTDHHWTSDGAYLAYRLLMDSMDKLALEKEDFLRIEVTREFYGSIYSKSGFRNIDPDQLYLYYPKEEEEIRVEYVEENTSSNSLYVLDNLKKKDKYTVFLDGNHPYIKIKTQYKDEEKLLLIKDSFANSLIPFLTSHFSEIHIIDPRYYRDDLIKLVEAEDIDKLLFLYSLDSFYK